MLRFTQANGIPLYCPSPAYIMCFEPAISVDLVGGEPVPNPATALTIAGRVRCITQTCEEVCQIISVYERNQELKAQNFIRRMQGDDWKSEEED